MGNRFGPVRPCVPNDERGPPWIFTFGRLERPATRGRVVGSDDRNGQETLHNGR